MKIGKNKLLLLPRVFYLFLLDIIWGKHSTSSLCTNEFQQRCSTKVSSVARLTKVTFNPLVDRQNELSKSSGKTNSSTSAAQLTGSKLLNHSDSAVHPLASFPSVICPQATWLSLVLNIVLWSIDWADYQGEKKQFVRALHIAFLDGKQNSKPQKCAEEPLSLPHFFKEEKKKKPSSLNSQCPLNSVEE